MSAKEELLNCIKNRLAKHVGQNENGNEYTGPNFKITSSNENGNFLYQFEKYEVTNPKLQGQVTYSGHFKGALTQTDQGARIDFPDGSYYIGDIQNGMRHGTGTFYEKDGSVYEGEWMYGYRHGEGKLIYSNSSVYEGTFAYGQRHGAGHYTWASGEEYTGAFVQNNMEGNGKLVYNNASQEHYEGQFIANRPNGYGIHQYVSDGTLNRYMGEWVEGLKEGFGIFEYADGSVYEGEWANDKKEGMGVMTFEDGSRYQGLFSVDKMVGSNLREIAAVRGWIDDLPTFSETFNKYAPFEELKNRTLQDTKGKGNRGMGKTKDSLNTTAKNIENYQRDDPLMYTIKKEVECNPYTYLIDFERLQLLFHNEDKIVNGIFKTFFRYNNLIKNSYAHYLRSDASTTFTLGKFYHFLRECNIVGIDFSLSKLNRDYFGRREPAVKSHIEREEFQALKRYTIKTATSKFNLDLQTQNSVSLFNDEDRENTLDLKNENEGTENEQTQLREGSPELNKSFNESRVEELMKTQQSIEQEGESKDQEVAERLAEIEEMNDLKNKVPKWADVHDKDNILVFRNYVELILMSAYFKYTSPWLDKNLIRLFEEQIEPNAAKGAKKLEGEHLKITEIMNKEMTSDYSKKLRTAFDSYASRYRLSDDNDKSLKFGVVLKIFLENNLLNDNFTLDLMVDLMQKNHSRSDQVFPKSCKQTSISRTNYSDDEDEGTLSDLHYMLVKKINVDDTFASKLSELEATLASLQKKREEEAAAEEANPTPEEEKEEKKLDPMELIKTDQDKKNWVLKELKMFQTNKDQKTKFKKLQDYELVYYEFFELMYHISFLYSKDKKLSLIKKLRGFIEETLLPNFNLVDKNSIDPSASIKYLETEKDRMLEAHKAQKAKDQFELTKLNYCQTLMRHMWDNNVLKRMRHGWDTWMNFNAQMKKIIDDDQGSDEDY